MKTKIQSIYINVLLIIFSFIIAILFYIYMNAPNKFNSFKYSINIDDSSVGYIDRLYSNDREIFISGWMANDLYNSAVQKKKSIVLKCKNNNDIIMIHCKYIKRKDILNHLQNKNVLYCGYESKISNKLIKNGIYNIYIYIMNIMIKNIFLIQIGA